MSEKDIHLLLAMVDTLVDDKVALRTCPEDERTWERLYERVQLSRKNLIEQLQKA